MKDKKKKSTSMEELTKGYEKFIEGKELNPKGKEMFEKIVKEASKLRVSK